MPEPETVTLASTYYVNLVPAVVAESEDEAREIAVEALAPGFDLENVEDERFYRGHPAAPGLRVANLGEAFGH